MLWLVDENNELLLAKRADLKKRDPGLWGPSVTGTIEPQESVEQALARETEEELGLISKEYDAVYLFEVDFAHPDGETRHFTVYTARVARDITEHIVLDENEVARVCWMSIADVRKLLESKPGDKVVASAFVLWERIFSELNQALQQ